MRAAHNYHLGLGWPAIGYHYLYSPKFREFAWVGSWETVRYHAGGVRYPGYTAGFNNVTGLGVCIAGDYSRRNPDVQTLADLKAFLSWLQPLLGNPHIVGHKEVSPTVCPGTNWGAWKLDVVSWG